MDPVGHVDATPATGTWTVDTTPPNTYLTSGPSGTTDATAAALAFTANEAATFECKLDGPGAATGSLGACTSPKSYSSLTDGSYTFSVRARDGVAHVDASPATRTWTVETATPTPVETTEGTVPPGGGTVSSDPAQQGPTETEPVTTSVTLPDEGSVTIVEQPAAETPAPTGYSLLGQEIVITAPPATAAEPLQLTFTLDASVVGSTPLADIAVFRNGLLVGECPGATTASPDPCVKSRTALAGGDAQIVVLTSQASTWNFGTADPALPPTPTTTTPSTSEPTPGPAPAPALKDTRAPVVRLAIAKAALKLKTILKKGLIVTARCDEVCSSTARLLLAKATAKKLRLAAVVASGKGGTRLVLKLNAKAKRKLARLRKVVVTLEVVTADGAGNRTKTTRRLTLRR